MKKLFIMVMVSIALVANFAAHDAHARKIKTKHSLPKTSSMSSESAFPGISAEKDSVISMASDSIAFCDSIRPAVRFYGFDKTVASTSESFFISNGLKETLKTLEIEITYTDMKGRQLHKRTVNIACDIPSGETKRVDVKSWDTQKSFYFHRSVKPKRQATPFSVRLTLFSVTILQPEG